MAGDDRPDVLDLELLRDLTETDGPPGREGAIRDRVVAAHMDEVGLVVRHVTEDGFLRVEPAGLWDPRVLRAQRVTVHTETVYKRDPTAEHPGMRDLAIDLGLPGEAVHERVAVGDFVTVSRSTRRLGDCVTGKALDNRVSVYALVAAARALSTPAATVHLAATVQDEVGFRGARALGVDVDPDLALNVDTTVASDVPDVEPDDYVTRLGAGAAIKRKDARVLPSPAVGDRLRTVAEERDIPHQFEVLSGGGTDTGELQYAGGPTPVGGLSVPTRYLHTPAELVHRGDLRAVVDLLIGVLETEDGSHDYAL